MKMSSDATGLKNHLKYYEPLHPNIFDNIDKVDFAEKYTASQGSTRKQQRISISQFLAMKLKQ